MPNEILIKTATEAQAKVWADTTDYGASGDGGDRDYQIDLTSIANNEARQGAKGDLGSPRGRTWVVFAAIEFLSAPTAGLVVDFYWAESPDPDAGDVDPGGVSGVDGDYTGTAGSTVADSVPQLTRIGSLVCTADATTVVQFQKIGILTNVLQYGSPVVYNLSGQTFEDDAVEMFIRFEPLIDELQ